MPPQGKTLSNGGLGAGLPTLLNRLRTLSLFALLGLFNYSNAADYQNWNLTKLETRLLEIDTELEQLPTLAMRSDSGANGYRSQSHTQADRTEWVQIDLAEAQQIDEIVLVPMIRRGAQSGFQADAFPIRFQVLAGTQENSAGTVIASFTAEDALLPRAAPLVIPSKGLEASWVRIVANELSTRAVDELYVLQLAEVMLFSQGQNIALKQSVSASSSEPKLPSRYTAHNQDYLVDGFVPYLMNSQKGSKSTAYYSVFPLDATPALTIDLEANYPLNQINLHAMELSDSVPQTNRDDYGIPKQLRIEGSTSADFSQADTLAHYQMQSVYDSGPIITLPFAKKDYRYLKFTVLHPDTTYQTEALHYSHLGLAEIEVLSGSTNVALAKPTTIDTEPLPGRNNFEALTDGRNFYGDMLPFDSWMRQLAQRHNLETERPLIIDAITQSYARQKANLRLMGFLASALSVGILVIYLVGRMRAMNQVSQVRKRFAADLHDEVGANLHAIGILTDVARSKAGKEAPLTEVLNEIRSVTERTGDAVRYCANSQLARDPIGSLKDDMHRIAKRMMHNLTYEISVEGESHLQNLKLRTRNDLFLFYKECLANVGRHSSASQFIVHLKADPRAVTLTVEDNGRGYTPKDGTEVPASLKRRAHILRGKVSLEQPDNAGTRIKLVLKQ